MDAYLLGFGDVIAVIAVIHRLDDLEDKLVVVPIGTDMTEDEIRKQTYFQEKWFHSVIYMQKNVT